MSTMMACEPVLMKADVALVTMLSQPLQMGIIPGQRSVLRVKQFQRDSEHDGDAAVVYVLDLIVQSEIVPT